MKVTRKILSISIALLFITSFIALDTETGKANPAEVIYNDFNDGTLGTNTGGNAGAMSPTGEDAPTINFTTASKEGDYALSIQYDFPSGSWEGYWSYFNADESSYDLSNYTDIRMWVKGASGGEIFKVELKDASGQTSSVYITAASGFSDGATTSWQELVISLSSFSGVNMGQITQVNLVFDESPRSGTVYIDKMRFTDLTEEGPTYEGLILDAFNDGSGPNDLGGSCGTMDSNPDSSNETISETYVQDSYEGLGALRLTYDRGDNWVGYWSYMQSDQSGYDVSSYELIRMFVKGASGGEIFKVELEDTSNNNAHNYIDSYSGFTNGATKSWQELVIPLSDFSGVNMSQLRQVNIVFDHSPDSGIVYLDSSSQ